MSQEGNPPREGSEVRKPEIQRASQTVEETLDGLVYADWLKAQVLARENAIKAGDRYLVEVFDDILMDPGPVFEGLKELWR